MAASPPIVVPDTHTPNANVAPPDPSLVRVRILPPGNGYRGYPRSAVVQLHEREAHIAVGRGFACYCDGNGNVVDPPKAPEPVVVGGPAEKAVVAPPADKSVKPATVKTK